MLTYLRSDSEVHRNRFKEMNWRHFQLLVDDLPPGAKLLPQDHLENPPAILDGPKVTRSVQPTALVTGTSCIRNLALAARMPMSASTSNPGQSIARARRCLDQKAL